LLQDGLGTPEAVSGYTQKTPTDLRAWINALAYAANTPNAAGQKPKYSTILELFDNNPATADSQAPWLQSPAQYQVSSMIESEALTRAGSLAAFSWSQIDPGLTSPNRAALVAPANISATPAGHNSLHITWSAPTFKGKATPTGYTVSVWDPTNKAEHDYHLPPSTLSITPTDLAPTNGATDQITLHADYASLPNPLIPASSSSVFQSVS